MKRYDLVLDPTGDCGCCRLENPGGTFVFFSDHAATIATKDVEIAERNAGISRLRKVVEAARTMKFIRESEKNDWWFSVCKEEMLAFQSALAELDGVCGNAFLKIGKSEEALDLDIAMWDSIKKAASESTWIPKQYFMNDWVSDVCEFLRNRSEPPQWITIDDTGATLPIHGKKCLVEMFYNRKTIVKIVAWAKADSWHENKTGTETWPYRAGDRWMYWPEKGLKNE